MSTLTYADHTVTAGATTARPARKPVLTRIYNWIVEGQQRRAEREIARFLANRGQLFTDETEREIMRKLAGSRPL